MSTDINDIKVNEESENYIGGLLYRGDSIDGYVVTDRINKASGEAELYYCEKNSKKYVLKYYYNRTIFSDLEEKLKALNHQNVMKILAAGKDRKRGSGKNNKRYSYEVDEFCEGENLAETKLPLSEDQAFEVLKQINEGLHAIHSAGIIHRDIKAENIYFKDSSKKVIAIGDFGISLVYDQKDDVNASFTDKANIAGTAGYMAPDVYDFVITPAIDYYSLAITFWHLLTGKTPFLDDAGQAFSSEKLKYDTVNEKIKPYLFAAAPELSEKAKKVISGLLVDKHDQRWGYNQIRDFLAGKDVPVFEERRELSAFDFCNQELFSLKAIAESMLKNRDEAIRLLEGSELTLYLDRNDYGESLTPKIEEIKEKYFPVTNDSDSKLKEYGLLQAAFVLYSDITLPVIYHNNLYEINTFKDFMDLLVDHPKVILPYLKDERMGLFLKLDAIAKNNNQESISKTIKTIVEKTKNESILPYISYLAITDNTITPFKDKLYGDVTLHNQQNYYDLPENLKERLMFLIDAKDKMLVAWFETVFGVNMKDWYDELEGGADHDELMASRRKNRLLIFGKRKYFDLFLKNQDVIYRAPFKQNGKRGLKDLDGSDLLEAKFDDVATSFMRDSFVYKKNELWYLMKKNNNGNYVQKFNNNKYQWKVEDEVKGIYGFNFIYSYYYDYAIKARLMENPELEYICSETGRPNERFIHYQHDKFYLLNSNQRKDKKEALGSFSNIQNITADGAVPENLMFWVCKNNQVFVIDKNAKKIKDYPYTDFEYVGNNCFIVTKENGIKSLVTYNGEVIREPVAKFIAAGKVSMLYGGNLAAIKKENNSKWEVILLSKAVQRQTTSEYKKRYKYIGKIRDSLYAANSNFKLVFFTEVNNEIQTTTLTTFFKGGFLKNSQGYKKRLDVVNYKALLGAIKKKGNPDDDNTIKNLLGFDGRAFLRYDFKTQKFKKNKLWHLSAPDYDGVMKYVSRNRIKHLVKGYLSKGKFSEANKLIDSTSRYYLNNGFLKQARFLLSSVQMNHQEGLKSGYFSYLKEIGDTYKKENEALKGKLQKAKDYGLQNSNYVKELFYYLSASGKEINNEGQIIVMPGFINNEESLGWKVEYVLECVKCCAEIINESHNLFLPYGWNKEKITAIAKKLLVEVDDYCKNSTVIKQRDVFNTYGKLYVGLGEINKAIDAFEKGMPYDDEMNFQNTIDWLSVLYRDGRYDKAIAGYRSIKDDAIKEEIKNVLPDFIDYYNKHLNEYRR